MPSFSLLPRKACGDAIYCQLFTVVANVFLTPFLLVFWAVRVYIVPCIEAFISAVFCKCLMYNAWCKQNLMFTDNEFQANEKNAGKKSVTWRRLGEINWPGGTKGGVNHLFNRVEPGDIAQGQLGDCWLLAGLATLAEHPDLILNAFETKQFNPRGKYVVRLKDPKTDLFEHIVIDDLIPCDAAGAPVYTNIKGNESWPLLLEKAFAKKRGGYHALEGGLPLDAMQCVSGYAGKRISVKSDSSTALFHALRKHYDNGCIMACGSKGKDNTREEGRAAVQGSIVGGHAYSILGMYEPHLATEKVQLLKLRNPWGSFEWTGAWSDNSKEWLTYPGVTLEIGKPKDAEDGIFFIAWKDFCQLFSLVDILFPETNISDLHITVHEDWGALGSTVGCCLGCGSFWCGCRGAYALCAAKTSKELKAEMERDYALA